MTASSQWVATGYQILVPVSAVSSEESEYRVTQVQIDNDH